MYSMPQYILDPCDKPNQTNPPPPPNLGHAWLPKLYQRAAPSSRRGR